MKIPAEKAATELPRIWNRFTKAVDTQATVAMEAIGETVLNTAIPLTPMDTGALRSSGRWEADVDTIGPYVVVSYGGNYRVSPTENAPTGYVFYAATVHEDNERSYRVGGPEFLGLAARSTAHQQQDILLKLLKGAEREFGYR